MKTWTQWKYEYKDKIQHIAGFEEKFVDTVLSKTPGINPDDVIPQYHFTDDKGKSRFIDFMILNSFKGYCLPIELDGYDKMVGNGAEYFKFNDFLERQNALIARFGILLRYSNKRMLNDSASIIKEIRDTLQRQEQHKSTANIRDAHIQSTLQDYADQVRMLRSSSSKASDNLELTKLIQNMQLELVSMKSMLNKSAENKTDMTPVFTGLIIVALALAGGVYYVTNAKSDTLPSTYMAPLTTSESSPVTQVSQAPQPVEFNNPSPVTTPIAVAPMDSKTHEVERPVVKNETVTSQYMVGAHTRACGIVAQTKTFARGVYLNLGASYPNQTITLVMWNSTESDVSHLIGTEVCASGTIKEYKGKPQINVTSVDALSSG